MFVRAERPADPRAQAIMFCLYTPDLVGLGKQLLASGVKVSSIVYPEYMPSGELDFADPNGFHIAEMHWGKPEQEAWEKRLAENKQPVQHHEHSSALDSSQSCFFSSILIRF